MILFILSGIIIAILLMWVFILMGGWVLMFRLRCLIGLLMRLGLFILDRRLSFVFLVGLGLIRVLRSALIGRGCWIVLICTSGSLLSVGLSSRRSLRRRGCILFWLCYI